VSTTSRSSSSMREMATTCFSCSSPRRQLSPKLPDKAQGRAGSGEGHHEGPPDGGDRGGLTQSTSARSTRCARTASRPWSGPQPCAHLYHGGCIQVTRSCRGSSSFMHPPSGTRTPLATTSPFSGWSTGIGPPPPVLGLSQPSRRHWRFVRHSLHSSPCTCSLSSPYRYIYKADRLSRAVRALVTFDQSYFDTSCQLPFILHQYPSSVSCVPFLRYVGVACGVVFDSSTKRSPL
jgi:hypothetical protein